MGGNMIPLFKPYMSEIPDIQQILQSSNLSFGYYGRLFESALVKFVGNENILTINSYNIAYFTIFECLNLKKGDEVIMSPLACLESTMPVKAFGLDIKWVDIDESTGTIDPYKLRGLVSTNTKLIIHNHFCGNIGFVDEVNAIAKEKNIFVIDDAIEAFGSLYKGKQIGNLGTDFTIFSFSYVRLPNTLGGSAITTNCESFIKKIRIIRDNGIDRSLFRTHEGEINSEFDIQNVGYSGMMSELNSYLGFMQMKDISKIIQKQRDNSLIWSSIIQNIPYPIQTIMRNEVIPNFWVFQILTDNRDEVKKIFDQFGFYTSSVHANNSLYSIFDNKTITPAVDRFLKRFLAIPSGWWVDEKQINVLTVDKIYG